MGWRVCVFVEGVVIGKGQRDVVQVLKWYWDGWLDGDLFAVAECTFADDNGYVFSADVILLFE